MRVLFIGDIFGSPGREVTARYLKTHADGFDLVLANAENATSGRGLTRKHYDELSRLGIHGMTMGNHTWDQAETASLLEETPWLIRPANYPAGTPGLGHTVLTARTGERLALAQVMGRVFMDPLDDPFEAADRLVEQTPDGVPLLIDFHAEATSEKRAFAWHLRGRAAAVLGTHTHVQTADAAVHGGTASITDTGMTGVQDSAIGMDYEAVHYRFTRRLPQRYRPADGPGMLQGVIVETSGDRAVSIERLQWTPDT